MSEAREPPVIGLLGAPGAGKSTVAHALAELGAVVIDADAIARAELKAPENVQTLVAWWGPDAAPGGAVDRAWVAGKVFADEAELRRLEGLIHPRVASERERLRAEARSDPSCVAIVEDCPLLIETGLDNECDVVVYVHAPRDVRLARLAQTRGWSEADLAAREAKQAPLDIKRQRAHHVIDNTGSAQDVSEAVARVFTQIQRQANDQER